MPSKQQFSKNLPLKIEEDVALNSAPGPITTFGWCVRTCSVIMSPQDYIGPDNRFVGLERSNLTGEAMKSSLSILPETIKHNVVGKNASLVYNGSITTLNTKSAPDTLSQNVEDSLIKSVQSSTRFLISTFRDKTKLLTNCSDLKLLLREGYKTDIAKQTAQIFWK